MMKLNENAANRYSYVGEVYQEGERVRKQKLLAAMPKEWSDLHTKGYIHIHDLDAYGLTNNCLTFNILADFPYDSLRNESITRRIIATFDYLKTLFADIGNEQSGGMALANFDNDLAAIFEKLNITLNDQTRDIIAACIRDLIEWCNHTHTRMGQTSYYVSFNIGLANGALARHLAYTLIDEFEKAGDFVFKPNIVFKVCSGVNRDELDRNYDLFVKALRCTAKKMIPTYLLCDCKMDKAVNPANLSVMGCRTRVVADLYGEETSIGRGNIANISINLPRLAFETMMEEAGTPHEMRFLHFQAKWDAVAATVKDILLDRFSKVCSRSISDFPINASHKLWTVPFDNVEKVFRHGTLSLGFIGLSEAIEILTGKRFYEDAGADKMALDFVKHMREYCDFLRTEHQLNFSLLATSGELISGRFIEIDRKIFAEYNSIFDKGFYTNSFHINVDSDLNAFSKIQLEGRFHEYCNGGCITYVELGEAPLDNDEGLREYVECAIAHGVHYLGFNFPKDICEECSAVGIFDECPSCGGKHITRIRRVSGYLELLDGFTTGKKNEERTRKPN